MKHFADYIHLLGIVNMSQFCFPIAIKNVIYQKGRANELTDLLHVFNYCFFSTSFPVKINASLYINNESSLSLQYEDRLMTNTS